MVRRQKIEKKQAIPKQTLYTAEYPTSFSQVSPALMPLQMSSKKGIWGEKGAKRGCELLLQLPSQNPMWKEVHPVHRGTN